MTIVGGRTVTVPAGYAAQALSVDIGTNAVNSANALALGAATASLTSGTLNVNRPGGSSTNALNVNAGTVTVAGTVTLVGTATNANRIAKIVVTTGMLTIGGDFVWQTGSVTSNLLDMSSSSGTVNLAGAFTASVGQTINLGTSNFNYNGTVAQTIVFANTATLVINYADLFINNTSASGATLGAAVTTTNVTGDLKIGITPAGATAAGALLKDNGNAIAGNATKTFQIGAGSTFQTTRATQSLAGFGTIDLGTTSPCGTYNYALAGAQTIAVANYGILTISGSRGANNVTLAAGTIGVACAFNPTATFSAGFTYAVAGSTVDFNGTGGETIPAFNYDSLTSSSTGARTLASSGSVGVASTFTPGTNAYTVTGSTVDFNGSGGQTIPAFNYNNVTSSSTGTRVLASSGTVGVAGTFTPGTNSYTNNGSTIDFNGTSSQAVPAFVYNNLTISGARTTNSVTLVNGGTITVQGVFNPSATFSGGGFTVTGNTVDFNSTGAQTVPAFNYNNLTVSGARTTNSVTLANGGTVGVAGTFNPSAAFTSGGYVATNNTVEYNGSAAQTLNVFSFANLRINNTSGLTLNAGNATISGTLALMSGVVTTTGTNTVITIASCAAPSVSRTSGHIAGRLQKAIPTGASTCVFEVGGSTATDYTPVQTSYTSVTSTGNVLAVVTAGDHPSLNGSGIDTTKSVNRYWTLTTPVTGALPSGGAGATYDVVFTFVPAVAGEVDAGANALAFDIKRFASGTWSSVTLGTRTASSTSGTTLLLTVGYGDFALGEPTIANFAREQQFIYTRELY